jgi:hypothetical protein
MMTGERLTEHAWAPPPLRPRVCALRLQRRGRRRCDRTCARCVYIGVAAAAHKRHAVGTYAHQAVQRPPPPLHRTAQNAHASPPAPGGAGPATGKRARVSGGTAAAADARHVTSELVYPRLQLAERLQLAVENAHLGAKARGRARG